MAMAVSLGCSSPNGDHLHSTNPTNPTKSVFNWLTNNEPNVTRSLISVSLEPMDMETVVMESSLLFQDGEELSRMLDALSSRVKIAEFIAKTLMKRLINLQGIRNKFEQSSVLQTSALTATDGICVTLVDRSGDSDGNNVGAGQLGRSVGSSTSVAQPTAIANSVATTTATEMASIPNFPNSINDTNSSTSSNSLAAATLPPSTPLPPPFLRRHTSIGAVPVSGGKWEERAAAFMMKRRSMQAAMNANDSQLSPKLGLMGLGGNGFCSPPDFRQFAQPPRNPRPVLHRKISERDVQEISWEFERMKLNPRRGALIAAAWMSYQDTWNKLVGDVAENSETKAKVAEETVTSNENDNSGSRNGDDEKDEKRSDRDGKEHDSQPYLTFSEIPWPIFRMSNDPPITDPTSITVEGIREFILSPFHSTDKSKKTRIRGTYMLWHPDKSARWLPLVVESDREAVMKGVERIFLEYNTDMNGSFRGLYSHIRQRWIRKLHDKATANKLNANAVSNEVSGPMDPTRVKKWNPWRSPFMWTIGFIPFFTFGLGTWQVKRLQWKNGLVRDAEEELAKEPLILSDYSDLKSLPPYRKVVIHGTWLHSKSVLLGPRKWEHFNGYHLVTPLMLKPNPNRPTPNQPFTIFINRGFVTDSTASSANGDPEMVSIVASDGDVSNGVPKQVGYATTSRHSTHTEALKEVEVVGILTRGGRPSYFTPNNLPEKGQWIWADLPALVEYAGGEAAGFQPMLVESIFDGSTAEGSKLLAAGKPVGRYPAVVFRNQHASYAITWYSLSLGTALLFYRLVTKKPASNFRKRL